MKREIGHSFNLTFHFSRIKAMTKRLRKRHLQIWIIMAMLLPVGIIVAWMSVPKKVTQELLQAPSKTSVSQNKIIDSLKSGPK